MTATLDRDLELAKMYFEELIQCVVRCGCWQPGWDGADDVAAFAQRGFVWAIPVKPRTAREVLDALERLSELEPQELEPASQYLELHFDDVAAFRAFWAPSIAVLARALR